MSSHNTKALHCPECKKFKLLPRGQEWLEKRELMASQQQAIDEGNARLKTMICPDCRKTSGL
ncbi:MAG TPA: hypothetical protein VGA49_01295 [Patescibacteria group bacterium]